MGIGYIGEIGSMSDRMMRLGLVANGQGWHVAGWRHPSVDPARSTTLSYYAELARIAERGKFDFLFLADNNGVAYLDNPSALSQMAISVHVEPVTLLGALAALTTHLGLVATVTTTYTEPYHVARKFAALDHLSGGRASWNVVTSANPKEAFNFSAEKHMAHGDRYQRAREFLEITFGLWDSFEDDAFAFDQKAGLYVDPAKMHYLDWRSDQFQVKGPLNSPRSPQGRPVIFQAGSSESGMELGAETADAIFTAQESFDRAKTFYADIKGRLPKFGRGPEDMLIFVGVSPIVGRTLEEAQAKYDYLQSLVSDDVGLKFLSDVMGGVDLSGLPLDEKVTTLPATQGGQARRDLFIAKATKEGMTLRELCRFVVGGRGHRLLIGTPESVADGLQQWFEAKAADGFLIAPAYFPEQFDDFVSLVVPELQRRGLFRKDYEGRTLREHFGLQRPRHFAAKP